ncbi:MAG: hypothetical protein IJI14_11240, partial [Anaerolineaceae bacterium]|nr:hypothetical protein [Anaerolineaceae bacterium]
IVESAGKNSLYVDGKILVANEFSAINTAGTNIYVGDYVMGFVYLNDDMQSYTIEMLNKIPEKSIGTPTPQATITPTALWHDLFTATPDPNEWIRQTEAAQLHLLVDVEETEEVLWDPALFGTVEPTATIVPTATPASVPYEGVVDSIEGQKIVIGGVEYLIDNSTGYKTPGTMPVKGDYVRGRAAPYPGTLLIKYLEIVPPYDLPGAETKLVYGQYQSQDTTSINVSAPEGDITGLFYPNTKMSKTFYTKNTLVEMTMVGDYVKSVMDFPLVQSGEQLEPLNGEIKKIIRYSDNEIYIVSNNMAYLVNADTKYIPDASEFKEDTPFVGLILNGRIVLLCFTDNNRVKTIKGQVSYYGTSDGLVVFNIGGIEYKVNKDTVLMGENLQKHSEVMGYADSQNNVFYLNVKTPWYSMFKDWNWTIIAPAVVIGLALIFFLVLHRSRVTGYVQDVKGNILTLSDETGSNSRHYKCTDEVSKYAGSLITSKVEITVYHGKAIHIRYDF